MATTDTASVTRNHDSSLDRIIILKNVKVSAYILFPRTVSIIGIIAKGRRYMLYSLWKNIIYSPLVIIIVIIDG